MALKHSKFKNPGLLFELLVRQITADTLENKDSKAIDILKKYFSKTELAKEYNIYKVLSENKNISDSKASMLMESSTQAYSKLNQSQLRKEKYAIIADIKEAYNLDDFFKAKLDNYKTLASIYLLLESNSSQESINPETVTEYKMTILEGMTKTNASKEVKSEVLEEYNENDKETRLLVYKILVGKFNDKYKDALNERQKNLLKEYITEVSMTPNLREYVNEQLMVVRQELKTSLPTIQDKTIQIKVKQVAEIIKEIPKTKSVTDDDVSNLFNYYQLVDEINQVTKK